MVDLFINSYCHIVPSQIICDGKPIFTSKEAQADGFLKEAYIYLAMNYSKFYKMDNLCKLGILASELVIKEEFLGAGIARNQYGVVLSNKDSSWDSDLKHQEAIANKDSFFPSPAVFVYTLPNIVAGEICIKHQLKGENAFFISPKMDAQQLRLLSENLFYKSQTQAALVGWINVYEDNYEAFLMWVSPLNLGLSALFTTNNIETIYSKKDGRFN